jgi:Leucine-rich repeat (LRR) protein
MDWSKYSIESQKLKINFKEKDTLHNIPDFPYLKTLKMKVNIDSFEGFGNLMPKLKKLKISTYESIENFVGMALNLDNLEIFDISNINIKNLKGMPKKLPKLQQIIFGNIKSKNLIGMTEFLPELQKIDLNNCSIEKLNGIPEKLPRLKEIELSNNKLTDFSKISQELPDLLIINAIGNKLINFLGIPDSLPKIETFNVSENNITNFKGFPKCSNLNNLDCSNNRINQLKNIAKSFPKLNIFDLSGNKLIDCQNFPENVPRLAELSLSNNLLKSLKGLPKSMPNLYKLILNNNYLENLIGFPTKFPQSAMVFLKGNPLRSLHGLNLEMTERIIKKIKPKNYQFSEIGLGIINSDDIEAVHKYYNQSPFELAKNFIEGYKISDEEINRLIHEGGYEERQLLENNNISGDNPILEGISKRLTIKTDDNNEILK